MGILDWFRRRKKAKAQPRAVTTFSGGSSGFTGEKVPHGLTMDLADPDSLDHSALRYFSSKYYASNTIARAVVDTKTSTIINRGLVLEAKPIKSIMKSEIPADWSKNVEQRFDLWAKHTGADYNFAQNFYQIEIELFRHYLLKGKFIAILRFIPNTRRGRLGRLNIQTIHVDQLVTPEDEKYSKNKIGEDIVNGAHIDSTGTIVGLYLRKSDPKRSTILKNIDEYYYIPRWGARTGRPNFLLGISRQFPNDANGIPDLSPIIHDLDKIEKYRVSEVQAAVVNSIIALIQNSDGDLPNPNMFSSGVGKRTDTLVDADGNTVTKPNYDILAPGIHLYASQPGQKLESFDTKRPNVNFENFVSTVVTHLGAAVNIPVEILFKKFSSNYSASRAALLEYWRYVTLERANFAWNLCQPVYELWLGDEIGMGLVEANGWNSSNMLERTYMRKAWANAEWQGVAKGAVDPVKEANAAVIAENRAWTTAEANARELYSKSFDSNAERRAEEVKLQPGLGNVSE